MTMNLLSILLSIAMMFSGAVGLDADVPMATTLTISDVYFEYNDTSFELTPSLSAGVMTDNGTAVFDISMQCGEESLFPMQLVVTEDAATLVDEKTGKAFTIGAEILNELVAEALDMDELMSDETIAEAMAEMETAWAQTASGLALEKDTAAMTALNEKIAAMVEPVEIYEDVENYDEIDYQVSTACIEIDNDKMHELIETVVESNEEAAASYKKMLSSLNETLVMSEEEPVEITSLKQAMDMIGMTMSTEMTVSTTEDGLYEHTSGVVTVTVEEMDPIEVEFETYTVNGAQEVQVWTDIVADDTGVHAEFITYDDSEGNYFEFILEGVPSEEDSEEAFAFYMVGGVAPAEDGFKEYSFEIELSSPDVDLGFLIDGAQDEEGNNALTVDFEFSDGYSNISCGCALDISNAVFANAAEGITAIEVDPENLEALEAEFMPVAESLMTDVQTLIEDESVSEMVSAFMFMGLSEMEETEEIDGEYEYYEEYEEETFDDAEITFTIPEFTYIPEGLKLEDESVEPEFNSASYTFADEDYDNTFYIYVYGDYYTVENMTYVLGDEGSMTAIDGRTVSVQSEDGAIYAEMKADAITVNLSYYGSDFGADEIGKILAGMTY